MSLHSIELVQMSQNKYKLMMTKPTTSVQFIHPTQHIREHNTRCFPSYNYSSHWSFDNKVFGHGFLLVFYKRAWKTGLHTYCFVEMIMVIYNLRRILLNIVHYWILKYYRNASCWNMTMMVYLDKSNLSLSTCKVWKISINFNGANIS